MRFCRVVPLFVLIGFSVPTEAKLNAPQVLAACSAFAPDGSFVTATASTDTLSLSAKNSVGKETALTAPLRYRANQWQLDRPAIRWHLYDCSLFFDHSGDLVAVGITRQYPIPKTLQVAVADLKNSKWLSDFGVEQSHEPNGSVELAGFLEDTASIVITEAWHTNQSESVSTVLFDKNGKQVSPEPLVHSWQEILLPFHPDAANDRLWVFHCTMVSARLSKQPSCPITVTDLVKATKVSTTFDPSHYENKRTALWMTPRTFGSPDPSSILVAESISGDDTVWYVDTQKQQLDRFVLPRHHFLKYDAMHDGILSPDGKVFAFLLSQEKIAFPYLVDYYVYKGDDVVVLQVKPLRLLGVVPHSGAEYTRGLSVDHRNGKATVLVYRRDHWENRQFNDLPQP